MNIRGDLQSQPWSFLLVGTFVGWIGEPGCPVGCQGERPKFTVSLELGRLEALLGSLFMNVHQSLELNCM